MQLRQVGYPHAQLTVPQIDRCLEAFILWLLGKTMLTEGHGDTINSRFIPIAREIADARRPEDIRPRSFGSAVLAATYRGMCNVCKQNADSSLLVGCPLLLQLWSWERFPVGRPDVDVDHPWEISSFSTHPFDKPTVGTVWTRREVYFHLPLYFTFHFDKFGIKWNSYLVV